MWVLCFHRDSKKLPARKRRKVMVLCGLEIIQATGNSEAPVTCDAKRTETPGCRWSRVQILKHCHMQEGEERTRTSGYKLQEGKFRVIIRRNF